MGDSAESARYTDAEEAAIRHAWRAARAATCPRCSVAMRDRPITGGSFGLGYRRTREWLMCPSCRRSVLFDIERGDTHVMRALTISAHGGPERLEVRSDVPVPEPPAGWVRVRVRAGALNHLDLFVLHGMPKFELRAPWIMGSDGAGEIDAIGAGVPSKYALREGDRVIVNGGIATVDDEYVQRGEDPLSPGFKVLGEHLPGTFAEYVCVPARNVRVIPRSVSDDVAGAYTLSTLTAWRMCVTRAQVREGDDVLIWGIGGGVALASLAICKARGARVWVTSSSEEKLARARALGADETLNHASVDVGREIRSRTGKRGVTVVVDSVGTATWQQSLFALGRGGRLVTCGGTSGPMVETDVRRLYWNQWSLLGSTMGSEAEFDAVAEELRAGRLGCVVDSTFPIDRAADAFTRLERGEQFGKIVLVIQDLSSTRPAGSSFAL